MRKLSFIVVMLVVVAGWIAPMRAADPAPLTLVNGSLVTQASHLSGDPLNNGAAGLATVNGNYTASSLDPKSLAGNGNAA